ncbi:MAG: NUDIX hydrolase [Caldilineaceae bacterium]|nr:NUDIX hydrolase [Caldilineaceae bacterium]HRJ44269.1 NUDIX hydrolase [Caldilineaceae bacterium]
MAEPIERPKWNAPLRIRPISLALIRRPSAGGWLAGYGKDSRKNREFYRPPGGGIEFGENSSETVRREMMEEFGTVVEPLHLLGVTENIFTYEGNPGHEIVFLWETRFVDERFYALDEIVIAADNGERNPAHWIDPDDLAARGIALYPDGLPEILRQQTGSQKFHF